MSREIDREGFEEWLSSLLEPFFRLKGQNPSSARLPGESLEIMDSLEDFIIAGRSILLSEGAGKLSPHLKPLIKPEDRIRKKGRTLFFDLANPRRFKVPDTLITLQATDSFALEFRSATEHFSDKAVSNRFRAALESITKTTGHLDPSCVLAAGILPQVKKILGVDTPIHVELFGFPVSLRFLIAVFLPARIRIFACGPKVQEITH